MLPYWVAGLIERGKALFVRGRFESDLDEEVRFHIEAATERNIRQGMPPAAARRAAHVDFGGVEAVKEEVRSASGVRLLQDLVQDVRLALRGLKRHPVFSTVVTVTIALCIGANGAVLSVVSSVLLRPLPFHESDRLVSVYNSYPGVGNPRAGNSVPHFYDWRESLRSVETVALHTRTTYILGDADQPREVRGLAVTPSFFDVLRVNPALGTGFAPDAPETDGSPLEAILTDGLWRSDFGAAPDAIGRTALLGGEPYTVVGVLPPEFRFSSWDSQVFTTLAFSPSERGEDRRHADWYEMIGRLAPGVTVGAAQAELDARNAIRVAAYDPALRREMEAAGFRTVIRSHRADLTREIRPRLLLLWAGVLAVLAIGTANVTTLFLVRSQSRSREIATRLAIGAGRPRILRQLITESTVLALLGGLIGLLLGRWSLGLIDAFAPDGIPRMHEVSVDRIVVAVTLLATIVVGTVAGAVPSGALWRRGGMPLLRGREIGSGSRPSALHRGLVSGQIAVAFVLMMGASLLLASMRNLLAVDPGFEPDRVAVASLSLPDERYPDGETRLAFAERLLAGLEGVPGVRTAAVADQLPFSGATPRVSIVPEDAERRADEAAGSPVQTVVSPDYFSTLGIGVVEGRAFRDADDRTGARVAVVDETLARQLWPGGSAVGQRLWRGRPGDPRDDDRALLVVGVVETVKRNHLGEEDPAGAFYVPLSQVALGSFRLALGIEPEGPEVWAEVRSRVASLDPGLILTSPTTLEENLASSLTLQRVPMLLLSTFAAVGLFLGALGIYGVIGHLGASRRREVALRMAIGGTPRRIVTLLGREWFGVVGWGLVAGLVAAAGSARILEALLYGTGPLNPQIVIGALGTLLAVAVVACMVPLRRAMTVDPAVVLREG